MIPSMTRHRLPAVMLLAVLLAGCATRLASMSTEQRQDILPAFRQGRTVLDCRVACSWQWFARRQTLANLYATQQWNQLAGEISEIGYQEDLAYFWLGRAAAAQGFLPAAARYYAIAGALARAGDPNLRCTSVGIGGCFGVNVPAESYTRLNAVQATLVAAYRMQQQASLPAGDAPRRSAVAPPVAVSLQPPASVPQPDVRRAAPQQTRLFQPLPAQAPQPSVTPVARVPDDEIELPPIRR
jgi:hypothetical protein